MKDNWVGPEIRKGEIEIRKRSWNRVERNVLEEVMWTKGRYNRKEENKRI